MEQFANNFSTTLASQYAAGAGQIVVASASGAPTSGTFSLTILDSAGKVLLIFRVTSVSGTTFSGASEGADANAAAGSTVVGTMLTVAAMNQIKTDAAALVTPSNPFIQSLTAPISGNFTQVNFNQGSNVTTSQFNNSSPVKSISILQHDPSNTLNIAALTKAVIASQSYTLTVAFSLALCANTDFGGLILTDNSAGPKIIVMGYQTGNGLRISNFSNFATFAGDNSNPASNAAALGGLIWFRIKEDATNRTYYVSSDGINFAQCYQEAVGTILTTTKYGFYIEKRGASASNPEALITCYSFAESNP